MTHFITAARATDFIVLFNFCTSTGASLRWTDHRSCLLLVCRLNCYSHSSRLSYICTVTITKSHKKRYTHSTHAHTHSTHAHTHSTQYTHTHSTQYTHAHTHSTHTHTVHSTHTQYTHTHTHTVHTHSAHTHTQCTMLVGMDTPVCS